MEIAHVLPHGPWEMQKGERYFYVIRHIADDGESDVIAGDFP